MMTGHFGQAYGSKNYQVLPFIEAQSHYCTGRWEVNKEIIKLQIKWQHFLVKTFICFSWKMMCDFPWKDGNKYPFIPYKAVNTDLTTHSTESSFANQSIFALLTELRPRAELTGSRVTLHQLCHWRPLSSE